MEVAFPERKHSHWDKSILPGSLFYSDTEQDISGSICFCFHHIQGSVGNAFTRRNETVPRMTHLVIFSKAPSLQEQEPGLGWKADGAFPIRHSGLACCCKLVLNSLFTWQWASEENKGINFSDHQHLNFLGTPCACTQVLDKFLKDCLCVYRKET